MLVHNGQIEMPNDYPSSDTHFMMTIIEDAVKQSNDFNNLNKRAEFIIDCIYNRIRGGFACVLQIVGIGKP